VSFNREKLKQTAAELAAQGIFVGAASWKYDGWFGIPARAYCIPSLPTQSAPARRFAGAENQT